MLRYDTTMNEMEVLDLGRDAVWVFLNDVPLVKNPPLAHALYAAVYVDQEIPEEHYKAVAEIIGYVMQMKGQFAH